MFEKSLRCIIKEGVIQGFINGNKNGDLEYSAETYKYKKIIDFITKNDKQVSFDDDIKNFHFLKIKKSWGNNPNFLSLLLIIIIKNIFG